MPHKHGEGRKKKEKKKSPAEKRKGVAEAIETLTNVNLAIMCMLCDKTDCKNKFQCKTYEKKEISTNIVDDGEDLEE